VALAFGTSGLRAPATDFDLGPVAAYVSGFLDHIGAEPGLEVFLGCDLRASSPGISANVAAAITANGQTQHWCGVIPTPALAAAAMAMGLPAIEVTGSHNPEEYNGIKFFRPDGELLKRDEAAVRALAKKVLATGKVPDTVSLPKPDPAPAHSYIARYAAGFGAEALAGLKLGVFEHSAAGRDLLAEILDRLGAELVRFGRSDKFVAVDTEALESSALTACADAIVGHRLDAVVSTDGDGDRPLLIDADGCQITGDILCALAARALAIETVVTPLTSTGALEMCGWFHRVIRTYVGSPYVVAAMQEAKDGALAGFEANGGFLLGSQIDLPGAKLTALPTRDAVLPLVAVLAETRRRSLSLKELVAELPARVMKADRLKQIAHEVSAGFLQEIAASSQLRSKLMPALENPAAVELTDGARFTLADGSIVHFRASGNAPELRLYVETGSAGQTDQHLRFIMARLAALLSDWPQRSG
jgi:phosphomannomutase